MLIKQAENETFVSLLFDIQNHKTCEPVPVCDFLHQRERTASIGSERKIDIAPPPYVTII
jgi:hypothetical protein